MAIHVKQAAESNSQRQKIMNQSDTECKISMINIFKVVKGLLLKYELGTRDSKKITIKKF